MLNPGAAVEFDKHIGIPFLSGFSITGGSSELSVYDIFQEGGDINQRVRDAIFTLSDRDFFSLNQQLEAISFGWRGTDSGNYYSAGVYQELDVMSYFPKDLALLAYEGNANYIDVPFDLSHLSTAAELLTIYHVGINKKIKPDLQIGGRAKLYSSIANLNSTGNEGTFITRTTPDGPNFYRHEINNADVAVNTSGIYSLTEESTNRTTQTLTRAFLSRNLGVGIDLGATYFVTNRLAVSASLLDIGFVAHLNDIRNYRLSGDYTFDGIEFQFPSLLDGVEPTDYWENLESSFEEDVPFQDELEDTYVTWRPVKFNATGSYGFGSKRPDFCDCTQTKTKKFKNYIGLQAYAIKRPKGIQAATTVYLDKEWGKLLSTRFTYTVNSFSATNLGALFSMNLGNFNMYLAADNILSYENLAESTHASIQLGMQIVVDNIFQE
ncbi:hypothetical protein GCM10009117_11810 [Gangjinia marincola]|uniref:DUF5723 domain-containing protein n=2 Tax=Gangjinia marincola TaxID=578463 RepID=A0ABN1MGI8_9FLAO